MKIVEKILLFGVIIIMVILPCRDVFLSAQVKNPDHVNQENFAQQLKTDRFLKKVEAEILLDEEELLRINQQINTTEKQIYDTVKTINSLKDQLAALDLRISTIEKNINSIVTQIDKKESEIADLQYRIEQKKIEISHQKMLIMEYLQVIFKDHLEMQSLDNAYGDSEGDPIKLLFSDGQSGEKLRNLRYSEALEEQGREIFEKIDQLIEEQDAYQQILEVKRHNLLIYYEKLNESRDELAITRTAKNDLLIQTKGEEIAYRKMLDESKAQQEEVLTDISKLRKNLLQIKEKIDKLGGKFNLNDYAEILQTEGNERLLQLFAEGFKDTKFTPIWPVPPSRGLTAFFQDLSYKNLFGFAHNAVDIRVNQGTPIKSAADGIVYKAKDNGYGYSYIQILHEGGFLTTYGHISDIYVQKGDLIKQGDIIGLSGGMPGTKGAGAYTTGPHLHFEIIKDGLYVDPLNYMNLSFVPLNTIPEEHIAKAILDRQNSESKLTPQKVRRQENTVKTESKN